MRLLPLIVALMLVCGAASATPVTCDSEASCVVSGVFNDFRYDRLEPLGAAPGAAAADVMAPPIGSALNAAYVFSTTADVAGGAPAAGEPARASERSPLSRESARGGAEADFSRAVAFVEGGPAFAQGGPGGGSGCGSGAAFSIASVTDSDSALGSGSLPVAWAIREQRGPGPGGIDPAQKPATGPGEHAGVPGEVVTPEPIAFALIGSALLVFGVLARYKGTSV